MGSLTPPFFIEVPVLSQDNKRHVDVYQRVINFASVYDNLMGFWNYSDSVICFVFNFIVYIYYFADIRVYRTHWTIICSSFCNIFSIWITNDGVGKSHLQTGKQEIKWTVFLGQCHFKNNFLEELAYCSFFTINLKINKKNKVLSC